MARSKTRRRYSDSQKAQVYALLNTSSAHEVARVTGIPLGTVLWWKQNPKEGLDEQIIEASKDLREELRRVLFLLIGALPDKIEDAPLNHTAVALGILFDKIQLLEGRPTNIDEVRDGDPISDDERAARVAALLDAARARGTRAPN